MEKVPDNFFDGFPARMSDGRFLRDHTPNCDLNTKYKKGMNNWEYRQHLTENAEQIMKEINQENDKLYGCKDCHLTVVPSNRANQVCTDGNCKIEEVDKDGIGIDQVTQ